MVNALRIHPKDNVATVLHDVAPGTPVDACDGVLAGTVETRQAIPFGHKVAIAPIAGGEHVIKYGASIGVATADILPGEHVHSHNLRTVRGAVR